MNNKGQATSFRGIFIIFALIGVLVLATINFGANLQLNNGVNDTILNNSIINQTFTRLEGNLSGFRDTAQDQKSSFESEIPERGFGSLIIFSIVRVAQNFGSMIVGIHNILIVLPAQILGISTTVLAALEAIFLVTIVILSWRVYRVGS